MPALQGLGFAPLGKDAGRGLKRIPSNQRVVKALVDLAAEGDLARIERVGEHLQHGRRCKRKAVARRVALARDHVTDSVRAHVVVDVHGEDASHDLPGRGSGTSIFASLSHV